MFMVAATLLSSWKLHIRLSHNRGGTQFIFQQNRKEMQPSEPGQLTNVTKRNMSNFQRSRAREYQKSKESQQWGRKQK
jgi:hypothetical protein